MAYASHPDAIYDDIIENRDYLTINNTTIPIRTSILDEIVEHAGDTSIELDGPDGRSHTVTADSPIPDRDELESELLSTQKAFNEKPLSTLVNLHDGRLGPLHYTDSTAHFTVSEDIFGTWKQRGTGHFPQEFKSLGVKAAHLAEGFAIASNLPHHWVDDLGWSITQTEIHNATMEGGSIPEDRAPPIDECFIINVPTVFPGKSFGQATSAPAEFVNRAIAKTEKLLDETLLTKRMAQLRAIETYHSMLEGEIERGLLPSLELDDSSTVARESFNISASGLASLRSQMKDRRRKAFQTVRRLSDSDDFNYVMEEFAETIDELGELAMLGTRYREEILDEPPGFY